MTAAFIDVLTPGLQTTVQDLGRWGHQAEGVPVAGAMDPYSHRLANLLVGNERTAATLEVTLTGPTLCFSHRRRIAVAGADFIVTVDDVVLPHETVTVVPEGAVVRFGARWRGARAYLAVEGGIDVPPVLGSRATHLPSGTGGVSGRALAKGDRLFLGSARAEDARRRVSAPQVRPLVEPSAGATGPARVRVLKGPQHDRFADAVLDTLVSAPYLVAKDANRMGYHLAGARLVHRQGADIIPDATPVGSLQVPASGQPVLLMADRQTTGGYAKIATVITADVPIAAQAAPGEYIQFEVCTRAAAFRALIERERRLLAYQA